MKNQVVRRMVKETSTLAQAARFRRLNFAFHVLRHDSLLEDILEDWGTMDMERLQCEISLKPFVPQTLRHSWLAQTAPSPETWTLLKTRTP